MTAFFSFLRLSSPLYFGPRRRELSELFEFAFVYLFFFAVFVKFPTKKQVNSQYNGVNNRNEGKTYHNLRAAEGEGQKEADVRAKEQYYVLYGNAERLVHRVYSEYALRERAENRKDKNVEKPRCPYGRLFNAYVHHHHKSRVCRCYKGEIY